MSLIKIIRGVTVCHLPEHFLLLVLLVAAQMLPIFSLDCNENICGNTVKCAYRLLCHKHQQSFSLKAEGHGDK